MILGGRSWPDFNNAILYSGLQLSSGSSFVLAVIILDLQHSAWSFVGRDELTRVDGPEINVAVVTGRGKIAAVPADVNLRDLEK